MKKVLLFLSVSLALVINAHAYDFCAIVPSGQWLYFVVNGSDATIVYPGNSLIHDWNGFTKPAGDLVVPEHIAYEGDTFTVTSVGDGAFIGCEELTSVVLPSTITHIGDGAFGNCSNLSSCTIGDSVATIGISAFASCSSLSSIVIPDRVSSLGKYAFSNCTNLSLVSLPCALSSIEEGLFYQCTGLDTIHLPDATTSIGDYAFKGCTQLSSVTLGASVQSIGVEAFSVCTHLLEVVLPNSVTTIQRGAFSYCFGLTAIHLGNSLITIGQRAFYCCHNIGTLEMPNTVTTIEEEAFSSCGLTTLSTGDGLQTIGEKAFYSCSNLRSATFGRSIRLLHFDAFANCSNLSSVTIKNSQPPSVSFRAFNNIDSDCSLYYPCNGRYRYANWELETFAQENRHSELPFNVDISVSDTMMGTVSIDGCQTITITATAYHGYCFQQWNDGSIDNPRNISLTQDTAITAIFRTTSSQDILSARNEANLCLYPNPATSEVTILGYEGKVQIIDLTGKVVLSAWANNHSPLQLSLPSGAYFVKMGDAVKKLIVK